MRTPAASRNAPPATRQWRVEIPLPADWLSTNNTRRLHHMVLARRIKAIRTAAYERYLAARIPPIPGGIRVEVELRFRDRTRRDPSNFEPTIKPIIDALTPDHRYASKNARSGWVHNLGVGAIPDDDPAHLVRPEPTIGEPIGRGGFAPRGVVVVTITPLQAASKEEP